VLVDGTEEIRKQFKESQKKRKYSVFKPVPILVVLYNERKREFVL